MSLYSLNYQQKKILQKIIEQHPLISNMVADITHEGGKAYLVGGAVRDLIFERPLKDIDIEVHGLSYEQLSFLLKKYGPINFVGKSFGVLKLYGSPIDWSLPRRDSSGRKPVVTVDTSLSLKDALARRDLTMNALALDLKTYELYDPFNGIQDIQNKILRTAFPHFFIEDPLRFFRVMQFMARFEMTPDDMLNEICSHMSLQGISLERIEEEIKKLLLLAKQPSRGFRWIKQIGRLPDVFPELAYLCDVPQDPRWHPEGDVFEHTMQALDAAAQFYYNSEQEKLLILYAALCHDMGKPETTKVHEGRITSYGHEIVGVEKAQSFLKRITHNQDLMKGVLLLVRHHMSPGLLVAENAKPAAYKRLAHKMSPPVNLFLLGLLAQADRKGRNSNSHEPLQDNDPLIEKFFEKVKDAHVLTHQEEPLLKGKDLLEYIPGGPLLGSILKEMYTVQINENINSVEELKNRALLLYQKKVLMNKK